MGNERVSYFKKSTGSAQIVEEKNYYPFGLKHENNILNISTYNYLYNGKELQKETGWSDYGARMYMADIGRWGVIDPLAETSRRFTPYNYAYNNPISFIDPDGRKAESPDSIEGRVFNLNAPEDSLWFTYANGGSATAGSGDGIGDFFAQMNYSRSGGGGGANADDNIQSFVNNGVPYAVAVKVSNNGEISFEDYASSGNYFQGINFEQFLNEEEPVNFFGNSEHDKIYRDRFEQQFNKFKNTKGDGIFRVYGHGDTGMIWNDEQKIWDAKTFDKVMGSKNKNWKKIDNYKNPILFLYSCLSGFEFEKKGNLSAIARKISKAHPNLTVVGFDSYVNYNKENSGMNRINYVAGSNDGNGYIVIFKNGEIIHRELFKNYIK